MNRRNSAPPLAPRSACSPTSFATIVRRAADGLGRHVRVLYDRKLHEVRPDFIATTSENAGHDAGKSLTDIASAHDVMSFESYTDFGDWPMSAGFVADWGHAAAPGKPMWQAVESSQSEPAISK